MRKPVPRSQAEAGLLSAAHPDSEVLRDQARALTRALLTQVAEHFACDMPRPQVRFDLRGQTAGQALIGRDGRARIRYNDQLLRENGQAFLDRTVPHEVAHIVAHRLHGPRIRPHGAEWKAIMALFGADTARCHAYDTSRSTARRVQRHAYRCSCREHQLSSIRHNRARRGQGYLCRHCGETLRPA